MKKLLVLSLSLLLSVVLSAQTNMRIESQRAEFDPNLTNILLRFQAEANRRYLIDVSRDMLLWESHNLNPVEPNVEGYLVRQLDRFDPYIPKSEFYRVAQMPWKFQRIDNSGSWIGDAVLASNGSEAFVVYQNRITNTLFYSVSDQNGRFGSPAVIASTGAVDEPGFWDNSGYSDVSLLHYGAALYLVCADHIAKRVILLRKQDHSTSWTRHEISGEIYNHYWSFPKFAISSTGILGVVYATEDGTVFSYANHTSPDNWQNVLVTSNTANSRLDIKTTFSSESYANVFIRYHGGFRVSTDDGSVVAESYPDELTDDLSPEEFESMESTKNGETLSNHVRLLDGRIVVALLNGSRVIIAVED